MNTTALLEDLPPVSAPALTGKPVLRRRRLWQLPAAAHDLLLAMSLSPAQLHTAVERSLSRVHKAPCKVTGNAADVLYSSVRDLTTRNPLSEALQRELETRHAGASRALARLRDAETLRQAWRGALAGSELPAMLWALLTHPLGATLENAALYDARAWVFAQARSGLQGAQQTALQRNSHADLIDENARLRARLMTTQLAKDQQLRSLQKDIAQLRGELLRLRLLADVVSCEVASIMPPPRAATQPTPDQPTPRRPTLPLLPGPRAADPTGGPCTRQVWAPAITGQRVLCVGGMPGAQTRYRAIVEGGGGRFAFHDGGLEDSVQRLEQQLCAADVVVCQAGCLNHEAYRRIKGHCKQQGKTCLYVQRPSLTSFARCLGLQAGAVA